MNDIKNVLDGYAGEFNRNIEDFFPFPEGDERRVSEAMYYSMSRGGKRIRPFLVYETARLFGLGFEQSINVAMALEMLHTYSLIHDDLPAMDNDDLRRGFPTCHKQFDEATAIIAGDGLLTYAFEIISRPSTCESAEKRCYLIEMLGNAAGAFDGMVAGQMLDLISSAYKSTRSDMEDIIKHLEEMKTGRLLRFAVEAGAVLGGANEMEAGSLIDYSRKIGIAFQIADDILDVNSTPFTLGKTTNKDKNQHKVTFVSLYGIETARKIAQELIMGAIKDLQIFGNRADNLKALAHYIVDRKY